MAQQDLQLSTVAVLLAMLQVAGADSQTTAAKEDLSLPLSLDLDLIGNVYHLHWYLLHCSVGVFQMVPSSSDSRVVREPWKSGQVAAPSRSCAGRSRRELCT